MAHKLICSGVVAQTLACLVFQSLYSPFFACGSLLNYPPLPSFFSQQKSACYPPDRDALLDVATSSLNVVPQRFSGKPMQWSPDQDCCEWAGVTCGSPFNSTADLSPNSSSSVSTKLYSRVTGLKLAGTYDIEFEEELAIGTIKGMLLPSAICRLPALTSLDLSSNGLEGLIPTCFSHNLTSLQVLILSVNSLSGSLSDLLANLFQLTHLDLSINQFGLVQTSSIIFSRNLTYLDLSSNDFHCALTTLKFQTPCSLEYLDLSGNSFSGSVDVSFIKGLSTSLRYLDLSSNDDLVISLTDPTTFSTTPLLQQLSLGGSSIVQGDVRALEHLQYLKVLRLELFIPADSLRSLFCKLSSLQTVFIIASDSGTGNGGVPNGALLCDQKLASLNLTTLFLTGQGYRGPFPSWIGHFAGLQTQDLAGNQFEGPIPQGWQSLTQLTSLSLSGDSPRTSVSLFQEVQSSWLFRLPLQLLSLESMGLTSQKFPCASFSLLNHTLSALYLPDNHITSGHKWLLHCLQLHNFSLTILDLSKNPLAMPLQPHMFPVSVSELSLSNCQLYGNLPSLRTDLLSGLLGTSGVFTYLDLSNNELTNISPSSFWNLTALFGAWLDLSNNHMHGELILYNLFGWSVAVSMANNYLTKVHFHNASHLAFLDLSNNQLDGTLESLLGDYSVVRNLTFLLLHNNQLTGSIPSILAPSAPNLKVLDLSNNKLTGAIPPSLGDLQALQHKDSDVVVFVLAFIPFLQKVKNVELNMTSGSINRGHLDLSYNQLNGTIPDGLGALVGLKDLYLAGNQLTGLIPPSLAHLVFLESLDLSFNNLEGAIPSKLLSLTFLEVFNVSFNPKLSGQIPLGPQFETPTSFEGDNKLCGQAINKSCSGEQYFVGTSMPSSHEHNSSSTLQTSGFKDRFSSVLKGIEKWVAIPGILIGHVLGMGITIWALRRLHFYK